jgi:capsular polysaccharide transport system permease protein
MDDRPDKTQTPVAGVDPSRERRVPRRERQFYAAAQGDAVEGEAAEHYHPPARDRSNPPVRRIEQRLTVVPPRRELAADQYRGQYILPPTPAKKPPYWTYASFVLCVIVPAIIAGIYYYAFASNQYVAEFRFTVKDAQQTTSGGGPTGSVMSVLTVTSGAQDNYIVTDFLGSREAVDELQKRINLTQLYAKPTIDWWARFDPRKPVEKFIPYWQEMLTARYDQVTGIATAQVRAFSPEDALLIGNTLVAMSEELINRIANRTANDSVRFAEREVEKAQARLKAVRAQIMEYRNRTGVIDPQTSLAASNSALVQSLRANLSQLETQLSTLQRQNLQLNTPVMVTLQNQIKSTKEQLQNIESTVGQSRDGVALSKVMAEYEQLDMERQFAQTTVNSTSSILDQARANAAAQHLYITPYVRPSLPQSSTYPRPVRSISMVAILAFVFWLSGLLIVRSIRERFS